MEVEAPWHWRLSFWVCASVLVNICLPWIGVASNTWHFMFFRGVYIAWYFSLSRGGTLPGNVGPRDENTSNRSFGPVEKDTLQCKWGAEKRMPCMVIYVLEKRMFYMAFYCKRSGCQVKIWQNCPSTPSFIFDGNHTFLCTDKPAATCC